MNNDAGRVEKTLKEHCAEIGRKGGLRHTRKQVAAHRKAIKMAQRARSEKARQRRMGKPADHSEGHAKT